MQVYFSSVFLWWFDTKVPPGFCGSAHENSSPFVVSVSVMKHYMTVRCWLMKQLCIYHVKCVKSFSHRHILCCTHIMHAVGWLVKHVSGPGWHYNIHCYSHCPATLWGLIVSQHCSTAPNWYKSISVALCVCECERETERKREKHPSWNRHHITELSILSSSYPMACPDIVHKHLWGWVKMETIKAFMTAAHVSQGGWRHAGISKGISG